ncbi:hypothetical protein Nepgr_028448 [Nepenthes gracilis]|uniref:Uncharacterized protein n=1 Tax=Nepenthes gracilis TaxID=150966 RepID=A0AAD3TBP6_NEPGR|nr:hypothetical protein Nepgr_028448 [Nepenthes gracilis]
MSLLDRDGRICVSQNSPQIIILATPNAVRAVAGEGGRRMLCFREQVVLAVSIYFSTGTAATGPVRRGRWYLRKKLHGKFNLCVLIDCNWKWQA